MSRIYSNIWLSGWEEAADKKWLKENKITHILVAAAELEPEFPKKFIYKHLPLVLKYNFDLFPYQDSAADWILKAMEEGTVLIHGYRGNNRSAACLIAFLMKFFGWDYMRCYKSILRYRPSVRLEKNVEKAIHIYHEMLRKLRIMAERGEYRNSDIISSFSSSLKPCFLRNLKRTLSKPPTFMIIDKDGTATAVEEVEKSKQNDDFGYDDESVNKQPEILGGENITPRELFKDEDLKTTPGEFKFDPIPWQTKSYNGTDMLIKNRLLNKTHSMNLRDKGIVLNKNVSKEDVINKNPKIFCDYHSNLRNRYDQMNQAQNNYAHPTHVQNQWGEEEEAKLAPQDDIEKDSKYFLA